MAIIEGKFYRGKAGNNVLRKYRGKQVFGMKAHIPKEHLTEGTLKAAKTFGIASVLAMNIRTSFSNIINSFYDGTMIYRLNTDTLYCLNGVKDPETQQFKFQSDSFDRLKGFEFNADSPFKKNILIQPQVTHTTTALQIKLPQLNIPQDIKFPKGSLICRFVVSAVSIDLAGGKYKNLPVQMVDISISKPIFPEHTFEYIPEPGCLCITTASLKFITNTAIGEKHFNSKAFNPTAILNAYLLDGEANSEDRKGWHKFFSQKLTWEDAVQIAGNV